MKTLKRAVIARHAFPHGNTLPAMVFSALLLSAQGMAWADQASAGIADQASWYSKVKAAAKNLLGHKSEAEVWLSRIQDAAQKLNYSGTFVYQQGGQVQSSRITHFVDAGGEYEKLEVLDGQRREYIRHNDDVRCYMPDSQVILQEKRVSSDLFPALLAGSAAEIEQYYKFSQVGLERVGGRACNVVTLQPRDNMRYGYRLWSDQETGLLVKAQTLNEKGDVIEQIAFTDLIIGGGIDQARTLPSFASTDSWRIEKVESRAAQLTAAGWAVQAPVPGFRKVTEIKRQFSRNHEVGQIVYSDGLAVISVFVESEAPGMAAGNATQGPINIVSKRQGSQWLTVIGEVPAVSIHQVADSVEFKPPK